MSFPKRPGVPCSPTGQRRSFSVTMSVPDTRFSQNPVGLSDSGNLYTTESTLRMRLPALGRSLHKCLLADQAGRALK